MKLNCDMGEGFGAWQMGNDAALMPYVDMANIACGFHASDPSHMATTVALAKQHGVAIGAHPGYPDLQGFGRREMTLSGNDITQLVIYQVGALQAICQSQGAQVDYVKPHGALYNTMMRDEAVFSAVLEAVADLQGAFPGGLPLMVLADQSADACQQQAGKRGVSLLFEAFCDRAYQDDGSLLPRSETGAVLEQDADIETRVRGLVERQELVTVSGKVLPVAADTICVHGDHTQALAAVKKVREYLGRN